MHFAAFDVSLELIHNLREVIVRIHRHDPALSTQLRKAAASIPLNLSEGRRRTGADRLHFWRIAAGSADEVQATLRVAEAWGYIEADAIRSPLTLVDRVLAMTWRLTH